MSRSILLAIGLTTAIVVWMLSGLLTGDARTPSPPAASAQAPRPLMEVAVRQSRAQSITRDIILSGRTAPNRRVEIAAETEGRIVSIDAERGARVEQGQRIAGIDPRDRAARAAEAEALVNQRELEYEAAQSLRGREFMSAAQIAEANARLESARAALESIRLEIRQTAITAPFDGVLEERNVELGDYVGIGDTVATVVDTDPLIAAGDVSERDIHELAIGGNGQARLLSGDTVPGTIRYVAPVASETTRTFRVELSIPNPDGRLRGGMSAEVSLPAGEVLAHRITPALLTLDDQGTIGVKAVDARGTVLFYPVELFRSDSDGIWITGLPERVTLITVGQGFVVPGESVRPVESPDPAPAREYSAP